MLDNSLAARILLVSDDAQLRSLLGGLLVAHGYDGVQGVDSQSAVTAERLRTDWDVAIVDVSVPSGGAMHALRQLKTTNAAIVVIVPKKNGSATPHELAGGDVVLGKPFDPRELLLIIRGMLEGDADAETSSDSSLSVGPISLSPLLNAATVASREIELTDVETRILHELLLNATHPVTRERLTRRGLLRNWSPEDRTLDTHINRLRRKLGVDYRGRTPIRTITGVGYLLLADWSPAQ
ncbi:MAG TPA: response regulator transcription factor [Gammaproteobacteria bacterium]